MFFIETHCHLNFEPLCLDVPGVLSRALARGVHDIVLPAYDLASWESIEELAQNHNGIHPAFGLHPWVAEEALHSDSLRQRLLACKAVAVGEIGLDYKIEKVDRRRQEQILRAQLDLAVELDLPVLLHCRGAFEELISILSEYAPRLRGVVHAFSRGPQLLQRFLDLGLYVAFGGAITRPKAKRPRRSAQLAPMERILLETDAPSIGLDGVLPEQVEPQHIADIAQSLAEIRNEPIETIAERTTANARELFRLS